MNMYIPTIGEKIKLISPWTFIVWSESRNERLGEILGLFDPLAVNNGYRVPWWKGQDPAWTPKENGARYPALDCVKSGKCTLPKNTILTIDRIYIRKGDKETKEFDSVSFIINTTNNITINGITPKKSIRFWAKLEDVNKIKFKIHTI